jgi:hypothetical protein
MQVGDCQGFFTFTFSQQSRNVLSPGYFLKDWDCEQSKAGGSFCGFALVWLCFGFGFALAQQFQSGQWVWLLWQTIDSSGSLS